MGRKVKPPTFPFEPKILLLDKEGQRDAARAYVEDPKFLANIASLKLADPRIHQEVLELVKDKLPSALRISTSRLVGKASGLRDTDNPQDESSRADNGKQPSTLYDRLAEMVKKTIEQRLIDHPEEFTASFPAREHRYVVAGLVFEIFIEAKHPTNGLLRRRFFREAHISVPDDSANSQPESPKRTQDGEHSKNTTKYLKRKKAFDAHHGVPSSGAVGNASLDPQSNNTKSQAPGKKQKTHRKQTTNRTPQQAPAPTAVMIAPAPSQSTQRRTRSGQNDQQAPGGESPLFVFQDSNEEDEKRAASENALDTIGTSATNETEVQKQRPVSAETRSRIGRESQDTPVSCTKCQKKFPAHASGNDVLCIACKRAAAGPTMRNGWPHPLSGPLPSVQHLPEFDSRDFAYESGAQRGLIDQVENVQAAAPQASQRQGDQSMLAQQEGDHTKVAQSQAQAGQTKEASQRRRQQGNLTQQEGGSDQTAEKQHDDNWIGPGPDEDNFCNGRCYRELEEADDRSWRQSQKIRKLKRAVLIRDAMNAEKDAEIAELKALLAEAKKGSQGGGFPHGHIQKGGIFHKGGRLKRAVETSVEQGK